MGAEAVNGGELCGRFEDVANNRQHRVRLLVQQGFGDGEAFGDPGSLIEQGGSILQHHGVHGNQFGNVAEAFQLLLPERFRPGITEPGQVFGDAQSGAGRKPGALSRRCLATVGIVAIELADDAVNGLGVFHVQGKDADTVQCSTGWHHTFGAGGTAGGFQAHGVGKGGGNSSGASGVGTQGEGHQPQADTHRRAGTGAAAEVVRVERVGHLTIGGAGADQAGGELIQIGFAHQNRAGLAQ